MVATAAIARDCHDAAMPSSDGLAFQDLFPDHLSHCYGCGRLNEHGLRLRSAWADGRAGDEALAAFAPAPYHVAYPGIVYGGLIASLIDCHAVCTASAAAHRREQREIGSEPLMVFVTGLLEVRYLAPTPLGVPLELRARVAELGERKAVIEVTVAADQAVSANARVVAVRMPDAAVPQGPSG